MLRDAGNFEFHKKVTDWFLKNDHIVRSVAQQNIHELFVEGFRFSFDENDDPKSLEQKEGVKIQDPLLWLTAMLYLNIMHVVKQMSLKEDDKATTDELEKEMSYRLNILGNQIDKSIISLGQQAEKYDLDTNFVFRDAIAKIQNENELQDFKKNYFEDIVGAACFRMMSWYYENLFNRQFVS